MEKKIIAITLASSSPNFNNRNSMPKMPTSQALDPSYRLMTALQNQPI